MSTIDPGSAPDPQSAPSLEDLGWNAWFSSRLPEGLEPARVACEQRGRYVLLDHHGSLDGRLSGRLRHAAIDRLDLPAVGDWVTFRRSEGDGEAAITAVLPRTSRFVRMSAGTRPEPQLVAANVDTVAVVTSLDADLNVRRLERYLQAIADAGSLPMVLLSKSDACADPAPLADSVRRASPGAPVLVVSALSGSGVDEVRARLRRGQTIAFVGSSGVGKSTLVNALLGREAQQTGAVRESDGRGRHVTTRRELFLLPGGGLVVDTPGMREMQSWIPGEAALPGGSVFADVEEAASACRFSDCAHEREPGCAVTAAIADGTLEPSRLAAWRKLLRERAHQSQQQDVQALRARNRRWKAVTKSMRGFTKEGR